MQKTLIILLMLVCSFFSVIKTADAQTEIQVFGSDYPEQLKQYVEDCLFILGLDRKVRISIFITHHLPYPYEGRTIKHNTDTFGTDQFSVHILNGIKTKEQLLVLAHELIHVKQYASRKLDIRGEDVYWHGKKFHLKADQLDKSPWENEAYADDDRLTKQFFAIRKQTQKAINELAAINKRPEMRSR